MRFFHVASIVSLAVLAVAQDRQPPSKNHPQPPARSPPKDTPRPGPEPSPKPLPKPSPKPSSSPSPPKSSQKSSFASSSAPPSVSSAPSLPSSESSVTPTPQSSSTPTSSTPSACTVTAFAGVAAAVANCTDIVLDNINVPAGTTLALTDLLNGTTVTFTGSTTFDFELLDYNMIEVSGYDITITSVPGAIIDGNGTLWWDGQGSNGGLIKPDHFITVSNTIGATISNLYILNYPVHCFEITESSDLVFEDLVLDNSAGNAPNALSNGSAAGHNTDGFDVSSTTNSVIRNSIVYNQDDCVAITSGNNVTVSGLYCDGSHGLSIGSVGDKSDNNVTNILFTDSELINAENGPRIKTNYNYTGYVAGITWRNIYVQNITEYGIDIEQDYLNGGPTGIPSNGVIVTDITMDNITGTAAVGALDYYILCGNGSCSDFYFNDINIVGGTETSYCNFSPEGNFVC